MERHFTVSGFVIHEDRTLLHWHRKLQIWLPPGGHVEANEDPVQAVVREVLEETGLHAEVAPRAPLLDFTNLPQLPAPLAIIVATVAEGPHQHIDMSYALRPVAGIGEMCFEDGHDFIWVSDSQLRANESLPLGTCGPEMAVADDVRAIALCAIDVVRG